jgi:hypothetical protein
MDNDERERRDPDRDPSAPDSPAPSPESPADATDASPGEAEERAWPAPDRPAEPDEDATGTWPTEPPAPPDAWPTEPPAPGSAAPDAWPTEAPERGDEEPAFAAGAEPAEMQPPEAEPAGMPPEEAEPADAELAEAEFEAPPMTHEPPPSEVEAYPAAPAAMPPPEAAMAAGAAHSVPATATPGESTLCPRCGTENRPGLAFCRNCGQRLMAAGVSPTVERPAAPEGTQACPRCGTHNRSGVAFCQNCGANLRTAAAGYVPPAVAPAGERATAEVGRRGAMLGPVVLLIGVVGLVTGWLLPFPYGSGSLVDRALGPDGYGVAFWTGYPDVSGGLADQAYFGLTAPSAILAVLLVLLAIAGFVRAAPGALQRIGLFVSLLWSLGIAVLFGVVEVGGNWGGDLVGLLRDLSPGGIIFFLSSLIILIGTLTRFGRS